MSRTLRVVSFALPRRKFPTRADAARVLRAAEIGDHSLRFDGGSDCWIATPAAAGGRTSERGYVPPVHVGLGVVARLAWGPACPACES